MQAILNRRRVLCGGLALMLLLTLVLSTPAKAYCGAGSNTAYQDCIIQDANRAGMTAPYSPNTPADLQKVQDFYAAQNLQQQNIIAALGPVLQQADQVANYGLDVLRAGGDPNVFFAQQAIPSTADFSFQNPLYAGPSSDTDAVLFTISNLLAPVSSFTTFTSPFLNDLNSYLYTPTNPADDVSLDPTVAPGTCSLGNPDEPTTIKFVHTGSHPVAIYLVDYQCQDIPFALLLPGTTYRQLTFVGQTWRFYDAFNGKPLLGQPEFVIPAGGEQTYTIFDVPGQQQLRSKAQVAQFSRNDILKQRYDALGQQQLSHYYSDGALSQLRIEYNQHTLAALYSDPQYLYLSYELNNLNTQLRSSQPAYAALQSLNQEINSWTTPPADTAELRARYAKRLQSQKLQSQLESQVTAFLAAHSQTASQIDSLSQSLTQRIDQLEHSSDYLIWKDDWAHRTQIAYYLSDQGQAETQQIKQLQRDYPDFTEYQQVRREVTDLLPSFNDVPQVKQIAELQKNAVNDASANQLTETYQNRYLDQTTAALTPTSVPVDLESYYEQLNNLLKTNPIYNQLKTNQFTSIQGLEAYRKQVHDAVAQCKARSSSCDPATDAAALALVHSSDTQRLINSAGEFYELYNRFWYSFYTSADYLSLETSAKTKLQASFSAVQPSLQAAQAQFKQSVASIPQVQSLRQASTNLVTALCPDLGKARVSSAPVTDATAALCSRLDRMSALAQSLQSVAQTRTIQAGGFVYLPMLAR